MSPSATEMTLPARMSCADAPENPVSAMSAMTVQRLSLLSKTDLFLSQEDAFAATLRGEPYKLW